MVVGYRVKAFVTYKLYVQHRKYFLLFVIYTLLIYVSFKVITSKYKKIAIFLECIVYDLPL